MAVKSSTSFVPGGFVDIRPAQMGNTPFTHVHGRCVAVIEDAVTGDPLHVYAQQQALEAPRRLERRAAPTVKPILPFLGTGRPWSVKMRITQQRLEESQNVTGPRTTLVVALSGPRDLGQHLAVEVSVGWFVDHVWAEQDVAEKDVADGDQGQEWTHRPHRPRRLMGWTGTSCGTGEVLEDWFRLRQDATYLDPRAMPLEVRIALSSERHIGQEINVPPPEGWKLEGPFPGPSPRDTV